MATQSTSSKASPPTWIDTYNDWYANEYVPWINSVQGTSVKTSDLTKNDAGAYVPNAATPLWNWNTGSDTAAQKQALDQRYIQAVNEYNRQNGTNIQVDQSVLGSNVQPNTTYRAPDKGSFWTDLRDTAETAAVIAGNYYLPGSSLLTSKLTSEGSQSQLNSGAGQLAQLASGGAGGYAGNLSNYGNLVGSGASASNAALDADFIAADASQLAAQGLSQSAIEQNLVASGVDSFVAADAAQLASQGINPSQMSGLLQQSSGGASGLFTNAAGGAAAAGSAASKAAAASGLTTAEATNLAKLGLTVAGLAGGAKAVSGSGGNTGSLTGVAQDRSGFSSGSANYSPEYYAAIQSKYNQYMPQNKGTDITTDLKNWYETKYTPGAATSTTPTVTGTPTVSTTGTGYTSADTLTNLGIKPQATLPSYTTLDPTKSTASDVANEYAKFIAASGGGNTQFNRQAAINYLQQKGFSGDQINAAYNQYLTTLPASTGTTAGTMAANSTPDQIAQAYAGYANANGGDTVANRQAAINYLIKAGVPYATIQAAYPIYQASSKQAAPATPTSGGGGMLTGTASTTTAAASSTTPSTTPSSSTAQPIYSTLSASSNPQAIADAYKSFINSSNSFAGGDTVANREAAINYLSNLGVSNDTIGQAYGLFKGA